MDISIIKVINKYNNWILLYAFYQMSIRLLSLNFSLNDSKSFSSRGSTMNSHAILTAFSRSNLIGFILLLSDFSFRPYTFMSCKSEYVNFHQIL